MKKSVFKFTIFAAMVLVFGLFNYGAVQAATTVTIDGSTVTGYDGTTNIYTIQGDDEEITIEIDDVTIDGGGTTYTDVSIIVNDASVASLTLDNVDYTAPLGAHGLGISASDADFTLNIEGTNSITGGDGKCGIYNSTSDNLTFAGSGSLTANGGDGGHGVYADGSIIISAKLTAEGGYSLSGYGGYGIYSQSGDVTIDQTAGEVVARGGRVGSAGSDGGHGVYAPFGDIDISAKLTAEGGGSEGRDGGNGIYTGGAVTINRTAGQVTATGGNALGVAGDGGHGVFADGDIDISAALTAEGGSSARGNGGRGIYSQNGAVNINQTASQVIATGGNATGGIGDGGYGVYANGDISISAALTAEGGSSARRNGGNGIYSDGAVTINKTAGDVVVAGGEATGTTGNGGYGIFAYGDIDISAKLTAEGGSSVGGDGGVGIYTGGAVTINQTAGQVIATGGDAAGGTGDGGHGVAALGSSIDISAKLTAEGGSSAGGDGGRGIQAFGSITISAQTTAKGGDAANFGGNGVGADGNITVSAKLTATGGSATGGGAGITNGGDITINKTAGQVVATGGNGTAGGGVGVGVGGNITISAKLTATGGSSADGTGGEGIVCSGNVKINQTAGHVIAAGGNATGATGEGGYGVVSFGDIIVSAKLTATGGSSVGGYGGVGIIGFIGNIKIDAVITAKGGNDSMPVGFKVNIGIVALDISDTGNGVLLTNKSIGSTIKGGTGAADIFCNYITLPSGSPYTLIGFNPRTGMPGGKPKKVIYTDVSNNNHSSRQPVQQAADDKLIDRLDAKSDLEISLTANTNNAALSGKTLNEVAAGKKVLRVTQGIYTITLSPELLKSLNLSDTDKIDITMQKTSADGLDSLLKIDEVNGELLLNAVDVTFEINGTQMTSFDYPIIFSVDVSVFDLTNEQKAGLTGIRILLNGEIVRLGGYVDGDDFIFTTMQLSKYGVAITDDIIKIVTTINSTTYTINGKKMTTDVAPMIISDRTMVPVRFIAEALGAEVTWTDETKTAGITLDGKSLTLTVGQKSSGMDVAPAIINGRTLVPLRYISEKLGANVIWNAETNSIDIYK